MNVHPLVPVTVTVYVAAVETLMLEVVAPLFHKYDVPPVAVNVAELVLQFSDTVFEDMPTVGAAKLFVTVDVPFDVQPLAPVMVTL